MNEKHESGDSNRREVENLREAYRRLNDPSRDRELFDTLKFADTVIAKATEDGQETVVEWLNRQAELIRNEVPG
jgi:hypothetical protein